MSTYIHYHLSFLRLAERGELDEAAIRALLDERGRLLDLYARYPAERHAFLSGATEGEPSKADDLVTPALRRLEFACDGEPSYTTPCR
jgi:hypothetical protein